MTRRNSRIYLSFLLAAFVVTVLTGDLLALVCGALFFVLGALLGVASWREYQADQMRSVLRTESRVDIGLWQKSKSAERQNGRTRS